MVEGKPEEGVPFIIKDQYLVPWTIPKHTNDIQQEHFLKNIIDAEVLQIRYHITLGMIQIS